MEWLRDPIWQFVGAVIGIVAIFITYLVFKRQQKMKSIVYEIVSKTPLLSVKGELKNKMQVLYAQKTIENLNLLILRIKNSGNEPVLPTDFEKPITIEFEETTEILEVESIEVSPQNLQPNVEINGNKISLLPLLLNEKDYITLKILLTDFNDKVNVSGRIAGVRHILGIGADRLSYRPSFLTDLILISFVSSFLLPPALFALLLFNSDEFGGGMLFSVITLVVLVLVIINIWDTKKKIDGLLKR